MRARDLGMLAIATSLACGRVGFEKRRGAVDDGGDDGGAFGGFCMPGQTSMCSNGAFQLCSDAGTWCACPDVPPLAGSCTGSTTWNGCRGNGCAVCTELIRDYPCYLENHPDCRANSTCAGSYFDCNALCPQPATADACVCTAGASWSGCGTGCDVCTEAVVQYACYFIHHPQCREATCGSARSGCDPRCPPPAIADRGADVTGP